MILTTNQQILFTRVEELYSAKLLHNSVLHIDAVAGSGKSFMINYIVKTLGVTDYIYTAFNKAIVAEGIKHHGKARSKTYHAFAYKYITNVNVGNFYPSSIKDKITYNEKVQIVTILDAYFQSADEFLDDYLSTLKPKPKAYIEDLCFKYLEAMADRTIPHTFNYMLKELHLNLLHRKVVIDLDMLLVDETQDVVPVMLEIFALVNTKVTLYFGDAEQSIYAFMDLVSAFEHAPEVYTMPDSFRLSPSNGAIVQDFVRKYLEPTFEFTGHNTSPKRDGSFMTLTQNNAEILEQVYEFQKSGTSYSLTRDIKDIAEIPLKVEAILEEGFYGRHSNRDPRFFEFIKVMSSKGKLKLRDSLVSPDIVAAARVVKRLVKLGTTVKRIVTNDKLNTVNTKNLISTVFSVKGLEADTVYLSKGLKSATTTCQKHYSEPDYSDFTDAQKQDLAVQFRLMYVAMTRARFSIEYL